MGPIFQPTGNSTKMRWLDLCHPWTNQSSVTSSPGRTLHQLFVTFAPPSFSTVQPKGPSSTTAMILFPNSGLQPRIAPVCTGASAGSSSTRCRRRPRRFRRRRLWCRARLFHFNRVPEKVPEKVWEALVQSQVRFNRVSEKGSGEGSGEGLGGFGAEPGQVQQDSGEGFRRRCGWRRARLGSTGFRRRFRRRFREALVQSQVRFNRVPEKVPEKVWEALAQSQVRFNRDLRPFNSRKPSWGVSGAWLRSTLQKDL